MLTWKQAKGDGRVSVAGISNINIAGRIPMMYIPPPGSTLYSNFERNQVQDEATLNPQLPSPSRVRRETQAQERERRFHPLREAPSSPDSDYRRKMSESAISDGDLRSPGAIRARARRPWRRTGKRARTWSPSPPRHSSRSQSRGKGRRKSVSPEPHLLRSQQNMKDEHEENEEMEMPMGPLQIFAPRRENSYSSDMAEKLGDQRTCHATQREICKKPRVPGLSLSQVLEKLQGMTGVPINDLKITGQTDDVNTSEIAVIELCEM